MREDKFWKWFFIIAFAGLFFLIALLLWRVDTTVFRDALVFDVAPSDTVDPFATSTGSTVTSVLYSDGLAKGVSGTSWGSRVTWNVATRVGSLKHIEAEIDDAWGGLYFSFPVLITTAYQGISVTVTPQSSELFIELYDSTGKTLGRQPLSWYAPAHTLQPRAANVIVVPLIHLGALNARVAGVSLISETKGHLAVSALNFVKDLPATSERNPAPQKGVVETPAFTLTTIGRLPYAPIINSSLRDDWRILWGRFTIEGNEILESSDSGSSDSSGAFALYLHGLNWTAYQFDIATVWGSAEAISLAGRYADEKNYVSCAFTQGGAYVQIYEVVRGVSTQVAQSPELPIAYFGHTDQKHYGLRVVGKKLTCLIDGEPTLSAELPQMASRGTIGIEVWDPLRGGRPHRIQELTVTSLTQ